MNNVTLLTRLNLGWTRVEPMGTLSQPEHDVRYFFTLLF